MVLKPAEKIIIRHNDWKLKLENVTLKEDKIRKLNKTQYRK